MDYVSIILSMCIGNAVAWFAAVYRPSATRNLLWNVILGSIAAALCGLALGRITPEYASVGLLIAGPLCAWAAILAAERLRCHL
ncbi:MAG: hypothetical protein AB7U38_10110 [Hyphomicrobiales bacterium]